MNDLTYGATLIALFATLVAAAIVEATAPTVPVASITVAPRIAHTLPCRTLPTKGSNTDCTIVALAPADAR